MKRLAKTNPGARRAGQIRVGILVQLVLVLVLGLIAGKYWYLHTKGNRSAAGDVLSANTRTVLAQLDAPVELRFYSLLDPVNVPAPVQKFSGRVKNLLAAYAAAAPGKVTVKRFDTLSDANANAAAADGITVFNLDKGEACYLGVTVVCAGSKESLAQLSPEWEPALESDLTRAILRVVSAQVPVAKFSATAPADDKSAVEAVKKLVPDYADVSVADGDQRIRAVGLADFQAAAKEMEPRLADARQRLGQAQAGSSEADKQAALKQLQQLQTEQTAKLNEIATRVQAQIGALEKLKKP